MKRKPVARVAGPISRALVPAQNTSHALRAVMLLALAGGLTACDEASRAVHRAGVWIGVIEEPRAVAGQLEAVHPMPATSTSSSAP